jgi:alpha-L-fucosidase
MKKKLILLAIVALFSSSVTFAQEQLEDLSHWLYDASTTNETRQEYEQRMNWFMEARFGMFIHWSPVGVVDQEIGWSWGRSVPAEKYIKLCNDFNPINFDAEQWVKIAKDAGMKYIVFVPKHHSGFSMWDTKATKFNIMNSAYGEDVCKLLSEACEKEGITFCTYYSIADIHENGWPYMFPVGAKNVPPVKGGMDSYLEFVKMQCAELVRKYNTKNFWFDGFWHPEWYENPKYRNELYNYIKSLDASIIMGRLQMPFQPDGGWWDDGWDFENSIGDYHVREDHGSPEWEALYYKGPWEFCSSVSYPNYSYNSNARYKTSKELIQMLIKVAGRNGNFLLNMAPKPDGSIPAIQLYLFSQIGEWMDIHGESIYGTEGGPYLPKQDEFASTRKDNKIYLHILNGARQLILPSLEKRILSARILGTSSDVNFYKLPMQDNTIFYVPRRYENENAIIIELTIEGEVFSLPLRNCIPNK